MVNPMRCFNERGRKTGHTTQIESLPSSGPSGRRRRGQKGSELLEFMLVLLPLLGVVGLIVDNSWVIFTRSTLQFAVREGARYAVTSQVMTNMGQKDSVKKIVQNRSLGLLAGKTGLDKIQVRFYTPDTFLDVSNTVGGNAGGNLVEVAVEDFSWAPLIPVLRSAQPLKISARCWDRMEASPSTGTPSL